MCELCAAKLMEMASMVWDIPEECSEDAKSVFQFAVNFLEIFVELTDVSFSLELTMRTHVRVLSGKRKGQLGSMPGSFETRSRLMQLGLTKTIVRFDDNEYELLELKNLAEISVNEQILLGLK
jgi:hypothetical protein